MEWRVGAAGARRVHHVLDSYCLSDFRCCPGVRLHERYATAIMSKGGAVMLARLGNVLYWLGCIVAGAIMAVVVVDSIEGMGFRDGHYGPALGFSTFALVVWLIGRACRYVLSDT